MPDYFFHVAVELGTDPTNQISALEQPHVSQIFKALKPFSKPPGRRTSRDTSFDRKTRDTRSPTPSPQSQARTSLSISQPHSSRSTDHRFDRIQIESADMESKPTSHSPEPKPSNIKENIVDKGIGSALSSHYIKGHYQSLPALESPSLRGTNEPAWGIVHLYRDAEETPGLYKPSPLHTSDLWSDSPARKPTGKPHPPPRRRLYLTLHPSSSILHDAIRLPSFCRRRDPQ